MHDERAEILWEDAADAERVAVLERWWAKIQPEPGSDEYLILQMMSGPDMDRGDPEQAKRELADRGLLELPDGHGPKLTDKGRHAFWTIYEKVYD